MTFKFILAASLLIMGLTGCQNTQLLGEHSFTNHETLDLAEADRLCTLDQHQLDLFTPIDHELLWDRIRVGYQLSSEINPRVQKYLNWYIKHPTYMSRVTQRGSKYLHYIVTQLEANDMPLELALLPIVESAFDPFAYSHGRASGIWQFIPGTGKQYGLKQNWWYDGRRDIVAATDAAIKYLKRLHRQLNNDWLLALAAYNSGGGNVRKAIRYNKTHGKPTDFWSLNLPKETKAYVPQLLALAKIVSNPTDYDITLTDVYNQPYFDIVNVESQIDLAQAALLADMSTNDLYMLNPGFNRWATDPKGPHRLLIPTAKSESFTENLKTLPSNQRVKWQRYEVRSGDSLSSIAKKFNTSVDALKDSNKIKGNIIRVGKPLLIPTASGKQGAYALSASERLKRTQDRAGNSGSHRITYYVKSGDSLWSIAKKYNVSVSKLAKWNGMAPRDVLKKNQKLVISNQKTKSRPAENEIIRKVAYRVRNGDSLARIAGKFNLSVKDIIHWNPVNKSKYIHPGQNLTLFVDVTRIN